ncbi:hypothetical protein [Brochothrix campestris]|uniref:P27 family phage terminase small subunit n=1 Tax=Brochothrix campestris FSL F6-1037 TaxID=1265861 RepID=W7CQP8_9LIST|nr:hypothetical protein [Brochothrix campestris]EUJ41969.1 hypothetical protein BCAMP_01120 [Brochothrix campestris FSL F6-1037]
MKNKTKIKRRYDNLVKIFDEIPEEKVRVAKPLMQRLAFMQVTLEKLEEEVNEYGPIILMENGKQVMNIENPAQKSYNAMINRYNAMYSKVLDLLPKNELTSIETDDGFDAFVGERGE